MSWIHLAYKKNRHILYLGLACVVALVAWLLGPAREVRADPGITLVKTVGLEPSSCANDASITLPPSGGDVVYCYFVHNIGTVTLTLHALQDSVLGNLYASYPYTLPPGSTTWVTQSAYITQTTVNMATWTAYNAGPTDMVTATSSATVFVPQANLALDKSVVPGVALPGSVVTYALAFANTGSLTATDVILSDVFPPEIVVSQVLSSGVPITDTSPSIYTWSLGDLLPGQGGIITVTGVLSLPVDALPGTIVANTAMMTCTEVPAGTQDTAIVTTPYVDLDIHKMASPEPATAGRSIVYALTVTNRGTDPATDVVITDTLPVSATLHTVDQSDDGWGGFDQGDHWYTYWETGRPNVPADNWLQLSFPITRTGVFTSRVFDAFNVVDWTSLYWTPRRPYGKPLPDYGQQETAYELGNADMTGNQVLLHLNMITGTTYMSGSVILPTGRGATTNTSGLDVPVVCPAAPDAESCPALTFDGRFTNAFNFDGALSQTMRISDTHDPVRYAIELWVRPSVVTNTSFILRTDALTESVPPGAYSHLIGIQDGKFIHYVNAWGNRTVVGTTDVQTDTWYHLVGTAQSNGDLKLFVNGREEGRRGGLGPLWTGGDHYRLGASYGPTGTTAYFSGDIDEVAIYSRTLSSSEIVDHYLRGALRLGIQVRSCDNPACVGQGFVGPMAQSDVLFTEQDASLTGGTLPLRAPLTLPNNRYAQYQVTLQTDDLAYSPQLQHVSLGPSHRVVTATQGACIATAHTFTCTVPALDPGETVTVSTAAWINAWTLGVLTNTAGTSSSTGNEITTTNNITELASIIEGEANLIVEKYDEDWNDGTDPVSPGSLMTYTLLVRNAGPSVARYVTVTDSFPGTIITATAPPGWDTCQVAMHAVTCTVDAIAVTGHNWQEVYDWQQITVTAYAPVTSGVITNTVWVTSTTPETPLDATDNVTTETTLITPVADLHVRKRASTTLVDPGATLTYVITVTNNGPYTATHVVVTDTLPASVSNPQVDGGGAWDCGWPSTDVVTCTLRNELVVGASANVTITVNAPMRGFLDNHVHVTADQYDLDTDDNWDSEYTIVRAVADLSIAKYDYPDPVDAGATLTYTLVVTNVGPAPAGVVTTSVRVGNGHRVRIPVRASHARPPHTSVWISNMPGLIENITVTLRGLSHSFPNDLGVLLVAPTGQTVMLLGNAGGGTDAEDLDLIFHNDGIWVSDPLTDTVVYRPTNNGLTDGFMVPGPYGGSLSALYGSSPNGRWRLYIIDTVYSDGGALARGWQLEVGTVTDDTITLTDTVHSGLTVQPPVNAPGDWDCYGVGSEDLTCETPYMAVDETASFTFTVTAPVTGSVITNTAGITSTTADFDPISNTVVITTTIHPVVDLGIDKQVLPTMVEVGETLTYTLAISNIGPSPVLSATVMVTDWLPSELSNVAVITHGWSCDVAALPQLTCWWDDLPVGTAPDIVITATAPVTPMVLTNTAALATMVFDPYTPNNTSSVTVTVASSVLSITKAVVPQYDVLYHAPVTYTVTLSNSGQLDAENVFWEDALPTMTQFARWVEQPTGAAINPGSPETLTWQGTVPGNGQVVFSFVVTHTGDYGDVVVNTAAYTASSGSGEDTVTFTVTLPPSIMLTKTVGTDPASCATTKSIELLYGTADVVYCYTVQNTGPVPLALHDLEDDQLGSLLAGWPYTLLPGASASVTEPPVSVTQTTTNLATWTAYNVGGMDVVTASDTATVTILPVADVGIDKAVSPAIVRVGETLTYTLAISNAGPSPVLSATVMITDWLPLELSDVGVIAQGWTCDLAALPQLTCWRDNLPVGTVTDVVITATAPATPMVLTNTAALATTVFDAYTSNNASSITVTVLGMPDIVLTKTVGLDHANCATTKSVDLPRGGGEVVYCYTVQNTGLVPLALHDLVDDQLGTLLDAWAYPLLPGASAFITVPAYVTQTTTNVAIWTAYNVDGLMDLVTDSDSASVHVQQDFGLYLPLVMRNYVAAPDLIVDSLVVTEGGVTVTIRNQGDGPVEASVDNEFWVDVYISPYITPTHAGQEWWDVGNEGLAWGITVTALPLDPGAVVVLTLDSPYYRPDYSVVTGTIAPGTRLWAQVDSVNKIVDEVEVDYGGVLEDHEILNLTYNNVYGPIQSTVTSVVQRQQFDPSDASTLPPLSDHLPPRRRD